MSGEQSAAEIWGTWEELLLASAVRRHGVRRWDSVAMEVKARVVTPHDLTPEGCEERFRHLQRRFAAAAAGDPSVEAEEGEEEVPWLEELRQLRVAELRRELERYDVSIMSLQSKVKRLKEERERSECEAAGGGEEPDLKAGVERGDGETPGNAPGNGISDGVSGRSCNESNSTDPKEETEGKKPAGLAAGMPEPAAAAGDEKSCNASSEAEPGRPAGDSGESAGAKEGSDVQSSASLSRRRRGGRRKASPPGGGREAVVSPGGMQRAEVKSQPLMALLEVIQSSEQGSVFERRLESQESARYRSLIRRHVDLEMVRSKLESGAGAGAGAGGAAYSGLELFRDLLLLCANATLFFPRSSPESIAAAQLRKLVTKEMAAALPTPSESSKPAADEPPTTTPTPTPTPTPAPPVVSKLKSETSGNSVLVEKGRSGSQLPPLVACRKRSSVAGKVGASVVKKEERGGKAETELVEAESPAKKRKNERPAPSSGMKGLRSNKTRGGGGARSPTPPNPKPPVENRNENKAAALRTERKNSSSNSGTRKGSAADLLSRMKQRSPPEATKASPPSTRGAEQKKGSKGDGRRDQPARPSGRGVTTRQSADKGAPVRRGVGRPPKTAASSSTTVLHRKRGREEAEAEAARRKRGRR